MALIKVTAVQLRAKAEELTGLNTNLKNQVSELEACEQHLGTMWEGQTKDTFHQAFCNDRIQMGNFNSLIDRYVAALLEIASRYEQAEAANTETASTRKYQ